jgi:hypothetical protein
VKARFGPFEDSANLDARQVHDSHRTCHRLRKSFYTRPMKHLGDVGHMESHFGLFRDSANLDARQVHDLHRTCHRLRNRFTHG